MENHNEYFEANRQHWNQRTTVHKDSDFYDLKGFLAGRNVLAEIELNEMGNHVAGKSLLHLQCHFGLDTLSFARMGAKVTGVDLADEAIKTAQQITIDAGLEANFVCCNVYDIRQYVNDTFDMVFTSYGTIGWLPNLDKWAKVIADSLNKGGTFYMADFHPVVWMFDDNFTKLQYPYANSGVLAFENQGTYTDREADISGKEYGWNHSISEILNALISNGLELQFFNEHNYSPYPCFSNTVEVAPNRWQIKGLEGIIPMVYSLKAIKKQVDRKIILETPRLLLSEIIEEEARVKSLQEKLEKSLKTLESDLEREKSISLDASLNEVTGFNTHNPGEKKFYMWDHTKTDEGEKAAIFTQYNYVGINTEPDQDMIGNRRQPTLDLGVDGQIRIGHPPLIPGLKDVPYSINNNANRRDSELQWRLIGIL